MKKLAKKIVEIVNQEENDYDAQEAVEEILKQLLEEQEVKSGYDNLFKLKL